MARVAQEAETPVVTIRCHIIDPAPAPTRNHDELQHPEPQHCEHVPCSVLSPREEYEGDSEREESFHSEPENAPNDEDVGISSGAVYLLNDISDIRSDLWEVLRETVKLKHAVENLMKEVRKARKGRDLETRPKEDEDVRTV